MLAVLAVTFATDAIKVSANPSTFTNIQLTAATTTPVFMSPGLATTTLTMDSQNTAYDNASLLIQVTGSGTPATLQWQYQFSSDGVDWYEETANLAASTATSTQETRTNVIHSWIHASTSGPFVSSVSPRALKLVTVPTPTRFIRVVFYLPAGSPNGALWAQFTNKKQQY